MGRLEQIVVKEYKKAKDYERDAVKMGRAGYEIISQSSTKAASGAGRKMATLAMPIALFLPHSSHIVVTYQLRGQ